jgi:hypothetical protein
MAHIRLLFGHVDASPAKVPVFGLNVLSALVAFSSDEIDLWRNENANVALYTPRIRGVSIRFLDLIRCSNRMHHQAEGAAGFPEDWYWISAMLL